MTSAKGPSGEGRSGDRDLGQGAVHTPVLLSETLDALALAPGLVVVDGTVGAAGHACAIARAVGPAGRLIGLDRDPEILARARERLEGVADAAGVSLHHLRFSQIGEALVREGLDSCDRVLLDLGVSSLQLDTPERGFSFMADAPLDMRMDPSTGSTAAEWLARVSERELADVLHTLGGERHARRIARALVARRERGGLRTTGQLAEAVLGGLPPRARHQRIHAATRTFQALRMVVNDELGELERGLRAAADHLVPGGRLVAIAFHSGEDRIVKRFLREEMELPFRKPVRAGREEAAANPRVRSARLRAGIRRGAA